jgi:hypothetical protein
MDENPYKSPETLSQRLATEPERVVLVDYFPDEDDEEESDYPLVVAPVIAVIAAMLLALYVTLM